MPVIRPPTLVIFDVNETLSDLRALGARFADVGAPPDLIQQWFPAVLRDGFALSLTGVYADFRTVALAGLQGKLMEVEGLRSDPQAAASHILDGLGELPVHPDVAGGVRELSDAGIRLVTLTVGSAENSASLVEGAGIAESFERHFSAEKVRRWKPAPEPYLHAAEETGVAPERCVLIAAHPWDVHGAKRAGLGAGWLNRDGRPYPSFFEPADATGESLSALAQSLLRAV